MGTDGFGLGLFHMEIITQIISATKSVSTFQAEEFLFKFHFLLEAFTHTEVSWKKILLTIILKLAKHCRIDSVTSVSI